MAIITIPGQEHNVQTQALFTRHKLTWVEPGFDPG